AGATVLALDRAGLCPGDVQAVFAEGCGTVEGDRTEAAALCRVFGPVVPHVTVPKAAFGHLYGASVATEVACALMAMEDGLLPPTVGTRQPAPDCPVPLV